MNQQQAERQAADKSKTEGGAHYVVWVHDGDGRQVFNREQCRRWAPLIHIECMYLGGLRFDMETARRLVARGA